MTVLSHPKDGLRCRLGIKPPLIQSLSTMSVNISVYRNVPMTILICVKWKPRQNSSNIHSTAEWHNIQAVSSESLTWTLTDGNNPPVLHNTVPNRLFIHWTWDPNLSQYRLGVVTLTAGTHWSKDPKRCWFSAYSRAGRQRPSFWLNPC